MNPMDDLKKTMSERGICVVIPTYNNGGTIAAVVEATLEQCDDVIVVNDGSTDATGAVLRAMKGITLVDYSRNRGKGYALKRGFAKALEMGFAYAVTLDADGQHYPKEIARLVEANIAHPGALIVGSRDLSGIDASGGSLFANRFSNFWFAVQTLHPLPDTQTGFRLYPIRKLCRLSLLTSRYEAELELLVFSSWHGGRLVPVPVDVYYPPREERVSHFRPAADFARISVLNTVLCFLALLYGLPLAIVRTLFKYLRTAYAFVLFFVASFLVVTPCVWIYKHVGGLTEKKRCRLRRLIHRTAHFVMIGHGIPGVRFTWDKDPQASLDRPHVIICNHQSHIDLMCLLAFSPNIIFLTNDWVWNNIFFGLLIRSAEYLPISEGLDTLLPKLRELTGKGYSIAVFPEGTRSADCRIRRFHQGAFCLADRLGLDVLPACLYGPGKVLPKKTYVFQRGRIHLRFGAPVKLEALRQAGDYRAQASHMRQLYKDMYRHLANLIEQDA